MVTRLESRFSQNDSPRVTVNDSRQSHFYNISEFLMDKPSSFARNEMSISCFSDDQNWRNFSVCLSSCAMLHFKDQVSPPCVEVDLRLCFHWGVSKAQYIDTLSWFNVVFAYRDHGSGPHTVTLSLFQLPVKWLKFSRFKSKPKTILQNIMQMRKPNLVQIQIPVTVISLTPGGDVIKSHITLNS